MDERGTAATEQAGISRRKGLHYVETVGLETLMAMEFEPNPWLVDKLIPDKSMTMIAGASSSFKTYLLLEICRSIAAGERFLDTFETRPHRILYIDEESGERLIHKRLSQLGVRPDLPIDFWFRNLVIADKKWVDTILDYCKENDITLVVIDSFVRINDADENDASKTAKTMNELKRLPDQGIALIMIHHEGKNSGYSRNKLSQMRGSSDIGAAVDNQISVSRKDNERRIVVSHNKSRYSEEMHELEIEIISNDDGLAFELLSGGTGQTTKRMSLRRAVIEILSSKPGLNQREIIEELQSRGMSANQKTVSKVLNEMHVADELDISKVMKNQNRYSLRE